MSIEQHLKIKIKQLEKTNYYEQKEFIHRDLICHTNFWYLCRQKS